MFEKAINNNQTTVYNRYNAIGQLREKNLHKKGNTNNYTQSIDYKYNERGWLNQINQIPLQSGDNDVFNETIYYNTSFPGSTPQYNGNISATEMRTAYPNAQLNDLNASDIDYTYTYDVLDRLTNAQNTQATLNGTSLPDNAFGETTTYDPAGRINTLQRRGRKDNNTYGLIDNLTYAYNLTGANTTLGQLKTVNDAVATTNNTTNDFDEFTEQDNEYLYDANGNMAVDLNKRLIISYNHLNLPQIAIFSDNNTNTPDGYITWLYTASGTKLQKRVCYTDDTEGLQIAIRNIIAQNNQYQDGNTHYANRLKNINSRPNTYTASMTLPQHYKHLQDTLQTVKQQAPPSTPIGTLQNPDTQLATLHDAPPPNAFVRCYKRDYIGVVEYLDDLLESVYTEEGRINVIDNRHEYSVKDHLGNTRICFAYDPTATTTYGIRILQQNNYYPSGLPIEYLSRQYPYQPATANSLRNNYQYNYKEWNDDLGLYLNDYGFRYFNPQLNQWHSIDPLAEDYYALSSYTYVANNPIKYTDPDGRWISEFEADPSEAMYELMAEDGGDPCPDCKVIPLDEVVITAERVKKETQQREVVITAERIKDDYEIPRLPENDPPTSSFAGALPIVGAVAPEVLAVGAVIWLAYYFYTNPAAITLPIIILGCIARMTT